MRLNQDFYSDIFNKAFQFSHFYNKQVYMSKVFP